MPDTLAPVSLEDLLSYLKKIAGVSFFNLS